MNVILRAEAKRAYVLGQINELQAEVASLDRFIAMAEEFSRDEPPAGAQTEPVSAGPFSPVVTPGAVASVAAEESPAEASSAPIPEQHIIGETTFVLAPPTEQHLDMVLGEGWRNKAPEQLAPTPSDALTSGAAEGDEAVTAAREPTVEARVTIRSRVADFLRANPDTTKEEIGAALGISVSSASGHLSSLGIKGIPQNRNVRFSDKLRALLAEHPDYDTQQAAEALDVDTSTVTSTAKTCGIEIKRVGTEKFRKLVQEGRSKPAAAIPSPEPETPPDEPYSPPVARPKVGKLFWLRNKDGEYLDRFCVGMTRDRKAAWTGTEAQIVGCKRNYKIAADLAARVVEK